MTTYRVWIDGNSQENTTEIDFGQIEADDMNQALDIAAGQAGYVDQADMAQALGWEESQFNIEAA